jgi:hypothetical protein
LIPIKAFGKHPRRTGGEELLTPGAIPLGKAVEETAGLQRLTVQDQALLDPFVFQRPPTMGTPGGHLRGHRHDLVSFGFAKPFTAYPSVSPFGSLGFAFLDSVILEGDLGGRRRRTEESLLGFALLIPEFLPQALIFFQKLIDLGLLFKAAWTKPSAGHQDCFLLGDASP